MHRQPVVLCRLRTWSVCLALALCTSAFAQTLSNTPDYLSPSLRAEVTRLIKDIDTKPTNPANRRHRARIVWDWSNAYAINGGQLPVELSSTVAIILGYPSAPAGREPSLDRLIRELSLLDGQPGALGHLAATPGPFEANSFATITQTYTVGDLGITTGGGLLLGTHFMARYGVWQTEDPSADNFVSISSNNRSVSFVVEQKTPPCMAPCIHAGFRTPIPLTYFRVASGTLAPGDSVTITYGDTTEGSRGFLTSRFATDRMPLPIYVAFDQRQDFVSLPIQPILIRGTAIAGVHVFAPSIVKAGEPFSVSVRAEDPFYNRATGTQPGWQLTANDQSIRYIEPGQAAIALVDNIVLNEPGVYRFTATSADGTVQGHGNPVLVEADPAHRIYWGDTHGHSGFAEGIGTPDRFMQWARDDARLDYVSHSEHDLWLDDAEWEVLRNNVINYSEEHRFVAFLGYEWTVQNLNGGHHNVLFRTAEQRQRIPMQFFPTLSRLYAGLRAEHLARDVVVIPHAHNAGDYRLSDPELEPLVEIMSKHGTFEWFGRMYLKHGHQVGFTAASDNHLSQPGYTTPLGGSLSQRGGLGALLANSRTRDALFDAMKNLKSYATTGERIILQTTLNGVPMGSRAPFSEERLIEGRVIGTGPIEHIAIVKNDTVVWEKDYLAIAGDEAEKKPESGRYAIVFQSASQPRHPGDNPRGWRRWHGTIAAVDAKITDAAIESFDAHRTGPNRSADNQFEFDLITRGNTSKVILNLSDIKRGGAVTVQLQAAKEFGGGPPVYRPHAALPAQSITFKIGDLADGRLTQALPVDEFYTGANADTVELRPLPVTASDDVTFEFRDTSTTQGDYYFVRARQVNDSEVWSSPIWVGGHPPK